MGKEMTHKEDFAALCQADSWRNKPDQEEKKKSSDAADECASCKALLAGVADILHSPTTGRSPLQAYGLTKTSHMVAAAKVLRHLATALRVRETKIREGKL
jgi:hypothetical protein